MTPTNTLPFASRNTVSIQPRARTAAKLLSAATRVAFAMTLAFAPACSDGDAAPTLATDGGDAGNAGDARTGGNPDVRDGGATTDAGISPPSLAGRWASAACETFPDGRGGEVHLRRDFRLTDTTWRLDLAFFAERACTTTLWTVAIDGPYSVVRPSTAVAGAWEAEFAVDTNVWTPKAPDIVTMLTNAQCGTSAWALDVGQDVSATGCIGVAHKKSECPREYDLVKVEGDNLWFGDRATDLCRAETRPTKLAANPVVRVR
jgi:hypothetical protein